MKHYYAFGLKILSELTMNMLSEADWTGSPDVTISFGPVFSSLDTIPLDSCGGRFVQENNRTIVHIPETAAMLAENGNHIVLDPLPDVREELLGVYVMGGCMASILYQRQLFMLHGSCVCKDDNAIILTGHSGAGKSTLAAEFLKHGWQIMTDDVSLIVMKDRKPFIQSSYPSQKLWQDAADRLGKTASQLIPLYQEGREEKFHVKIGESYYDGSRPVSAVVVLYKGEKTHLQLCDGFDKVNLLMRNRYQEFRIPAENRNSCFQTFLDMAQHCKVALAERGCENNAAEILHQLITSQIEL